MYAGTGISEVAWPFARKRPIVFWSSVEEGSIPARSFRVASRNFHGYLVGAWPMSLEKLSHERYVTHPIERTRGGTCVIVMSISDLGESPMREEHDGK